MSRRALAEKRPYLFLSIAAALAFYYLRALPLPELYLIPLKGCAMVFLAIYARARHSSSSARLLALALGAAALADMAIELDRTVGAWLFFLFHLLALGVFLQNRREKLAGTQSWVVGLTLILVPVVAFLLPYDRDMAWETGLYGLALGAMASGAWASNFPRYKVGAGAMLFVLSDLLQIAETGPLSGSEAVRWLAWPIYVLGQFLICTGVIQTLCKRQPELKLVSNR